MFGHRFLALGLLALAGLSPATARGQFTGGLHVEWVEAVGGSVEGLGTTTVRFVGSDPAGGMSFEPAGSFAGPGQPFLLGRVDFTAGGQQPSQLTFQVALDTVSENCVPGRAVFRPTVSIEELGEPGFRELQAVFGPDGKSTASVNGTDYTLAFAGVTPSTQWDPGFGNRVGGVVGEPVRSAYVWATMDPPPTVTNGLPDNCSCECETSCPPPGVPEPATWLLAAVGFSGVAVIRRWQRRSTGGGE